MCNHLAFHCASKFQARPWNVWWPRSRTKECVWNAPPTLDAKHLWFVNLEDFGFGHFCMVILTESVVWDCVFHLLSHLKCQDRCFVFTAPSLRMSMLGRHSTQRLVDSGQRAALFFRVLLFFQLTTTSVIAVWSWSTDWSKSCRGNFFKLVVSRGGTEVTFPSRDNTLV
jgi:hypothetical protein